MNWVPSCNLLKYFSKLSGDHQPEGKNSARAEFQIIKTSEKPRMTWNNLELWIQHLNLLAGAAPSCTILLPCWLQEPQECGMLGQILKWTRLLFMPILYWKRFISEGGNLKHNRKSRVAQTRPTISSRLLPSSRPSISTSTSHLPILNSNSTTQTKWRSIPQQ